MLIFFTVVVDIDTKFEIEGMLSEMLHADYFDLLSETVVCLRHKFKKNRSFWAAKFKSYLWGSQYFG